ncbi:hypothetical protein ACTWP5_07140 [Streptomyces sp. 4N509B]|uniref:hypothetical protein n=1 Tax=Streptomyces sp. 4N509B TaxID=3457413 RepID=UPI003FD3F598
MAPPSSRPPRFPRFPRPWRSPSGQPGEWYYCLKHRRVEEGPDCPARNRLGPYASREEAAEAIDIAHEREATWRTDPRWNDREDGGSGGDGGRDDRA